MIKIIRSNQHYHDEENARGIYHFSSGFIYDPTNFGFGSLRIFNEYTIAPKGGSEFQFNDNIEIIGYIIEGELEYRDDVGNCSIINSGSFYHISCGRGISYSLKNYSETNSIKILEIWIFPARKGLTPSFRTKKASTEDNLNEFIKIFKINEMSKQVSTNKHIVEIYFSKLCPGQEITYNTKVERGNYLFVVEGSIRINQDFSIKSGDSAQITYSPTQDLLNIKNEDYDASEIILIDVPLISLPSPKK